MNIQDNLLENINIWLSNESLKTTDLDETTRLKKLASIMRDYVSNLFSNHDEGNAAAEFLASSVTDPEWEHGKYSIPIYVALTKWQLFPNSKLSEESRINVFRYEIARFNDISDQSIAMALTDHALSIVKYIDVLTELQKRYLIQRHWDDGTWVGIFLQALKNNKELIGQAPIILNNNSYPPYVSSWLQRFDTSHVKSIDSKPDAYDQIKFFNTDSQIATLNNEEKQQLTQILHLYSWLRSPDIDEVEFEAKQRSLISDDGNWLDQKAVNDSIGNFSSPRPGPAIPVKVTAVPAPVHVPKILPRQLLPKIKDKIIDSISNVTPTPNVNVQRALNRGASDSANIGGVKFDNKSNIKVEELVQRLESERLKKQVSIDQKLEALKKRKSIKL